MCDDYNIIKKDIKKSEINIKILKDIIKSNMKKYIPATIVGTLLIAVLFTLGNVTISVPLNISIGAISTVSVSIGLMAPDILSLIQEKVKIKKLESKLDNIEIDNTDYDKSFKKNDNEKIINFEKNKNKNITNYTNKDYNSTESKNKILVLRKDR